MNARVAQLVTLVHAGNYFLNGNTYDQQDISANPNFSFVQVIEFYRFNKTYLDIAADDAKKAGNVLEWFTFLKEDGVLSLELIYIPIEKTEKQTPDEFLILARYQDYAQIWNVRWEITHPNNPDGNIWSVIYAAYDEKINIQPRNIIKADLIKVLAMHLVQMQLFASMLELPQWLDNFKEAESYLIEDALSGQTHLAPDNWLDAESQALLLAAEKAYLFGTSWYDIVLANEKQEELYHKLTQKLNQFVVMALVESTTVG